MKPLGQELSQLVAMRPVQEFKQSFLDQAAGSSVEMPMSQPVYNVYDAERRLVESWAQVVADDRAVREQMEREEAESVVQTKDEKVKQEAKHIEEQLKPILEVKQIFGQQKKAVLEAQVAQEAPAAQEAQEPEVGKTVPKKVGSSVGQVPKSPERRGPTIPFGCPLVKDPNDPWFGLTPGHRAPSRHPGSGESTPRPSSTPRREETFQPFKGIEKQDLSPVEATGPGPSRYTGTPSGIWLCTPTHGPGASL